MAIPAATRNGLILAGSFIALSSAVTLTAKATDTERPIADKSLFAVMGMSSGVIGAHQLQQSIMKITSSPAKMGPALIAAGVAAGVAGVLSHYATR
jgi:hypothetical protein